MVEYINIRLKEGIGKIINDNFTLRPGQILPVDSRTNIDKNIIEIIVPVETQTGHKLETYESKVLTEEKVSASVEVEEELVEEEVKKTLITLSKLRAIKGIGIQASKDIISIVKYVEDIKENEQVLRDELNDRYVNILLRNLDKLGGD